MVPVHMKTKQSGAGFTLIEILVVLTILAVLTLIGFAVFGGLGGTADDSRRQGDIQSIAKTYEVNYDPQTETYKPLAGSQFSSGVIPTPPEGGNYSCLVGPDSICTTVNPKTFMVCSSLKAGSCFCLRATQGAAVTFPAPSCAPVYTTPYGTPYGTPSYGTPYGTPYVTPPPPSPSPTPPPPTACSGLVAYWKMNDPAGATSVLDSVGTNNGTPENGPIPNQAGKVATAWSFDGTDDRINLGTSVGDFTPSNSFSVSAWFFLPVLPANSRVIVNRTDPTVFKGWTLMINYLTSPRLSLQFCSDGANCRWSDTVTDITAGTWHHGIGTWDGSTVRVYLNGTPSGTPGGVGTLGTTTGTRNLYIAYNNFSHLNVQIDEVGIWNRALPASDVTALYNGGVGMTCP